MLGEGRYKLLWTAVILYIEHPQRITKSTENAEASQLMVRKNSEL